MEFPGEDNHWTVSNRFEPVEVSQEDRDKEEHTSGSVKRLKEFVNSISDLEIKTAIDMIRNAKETDNHAQGLISRNIDFRLKHSCSILEQSVRKTYSGCVG